MTTYVFFCVDFEVNSLNTYGTNKKRVSVKDFREGEKMKFVVHYVFQGTSLTILHVMIYVRVILLSEWCVDLKRVERKFYQ